MRWLYDLKLTHSGPRRYGVKPDHEAPGRDNGRVTIASIRTPEVSVRPQSSHIVNHVGFPRGWLILRKWMI